MSEVNKVKRPRILYGDALRFLAIVLVILVHTFADARDFYLLNNRHYYFILTVCEAVTRIAVPIFFMLTGAFMLDRKKQEGYKTFFKKRVIKLCIPFLLISLAYYLYYGLTLETNLSILDFVEKFTNNEIAYHFWFMYEIILIYLLLPFLNKLIINLTQHEEKILILVLLSANLLDFINNFSTSIGHAMFGSFIFPGTLRYINYLFLGHYLLKYKIPERRTKMIWLAGILSTIMMPVLDYLTVKDIRTDTFFLAGSMLPCVAAVATFLGFMKSEPFWRKKPRLQNFFNFTTPLIFYIYMVHVLVLTIIKHIIAQFYTPSGFIDYCMLIAVEFCATLVVSYAVAVLIALPGKIITTQQSKSRQIVQWVYMTDILRSD